MKRKKLLFLLFMIMATLEWQCIDKYNSPYQPPATGYLVVEGYITGNGLTQFTLSRTIPLPGDSTIPMEIGAKVQVEGSDNSVYPLTEQSAGTYVVDTLPLNAANQYRLRIETTNGEQYLSSYVEYKPTPAIDSLVWTYNTSSGVGFYINTHDPAATTRYYYWNYSETWEYTSAEMSLYYYDAAGDTVLERPSDQQIYYCWQHDNSTNIILANSAKLAQDVISNQTITTIPQGSQKLGVEYLIVVRQYALTDSAYDFLSLMQQNTEQLGSIFDAAPSQLTGNIKCLTTPGQRVIGYISAGTVQQDSIFINHNQVPGWQYAFTCALGNIQVPNTPDAFIAFFGAQGYIPLYETKTGFPWLANIPGCVDCRTQGGVNVKPSFWPY
jgi:Domain of unknown function (DUF4249)